MEYLKSKSIRVPGGGDKVFKDECVYCFDSPVGYITRQKLKLTSDLDLRTEVNFSFWRNNYSENRIFISVMV